MKKPHVQEDRIKRAIRDAIVIDPLISVSKLQNALSDKGFHSALNTPLHWHYVAKLREKIHRQSIENVDKQKVSHRVAEMKERYRLVFERLIRIAFYSDDFKKEGIPPPSYRDQISALREISRLDISIFGAELDAGLFERHIGTLEVEQRNRPLPPEMKVVMLKAFVNWGIVPKEVLPHEPTTITIEPTKIGVVEK
jgi:hypothetical protein